MSLINPLNNGHASSVNDVKGNASTTNSTYVAGLNGSSQNVESQKTNDLSQEDFFSLLTQQLSMQDPFEPVGNDQMVAQMASFSTVDGITKLNDEIVNLNSIMTSSQALQASSLVGQKVLVPYSSVNISDEDPAMEGMISTPSAIDRITVRIEDTNGQLIDSFHTSANSEGNHQFSWNGMNANGNAVPDGYYHIRATGRVNGQAQELPISTYAHVTSVTLGSSQLGSMLNLRGVGEIQLSDVLAVSEG